MRRLVILIAVLALTGCSTKLQGKVGAALKGDHLQAKLLDFVPRVPDRMLGHDYSGLNAPGPGQRFAAAEVAVCNDTGASTIAWNFTLHLADGSVAHPSIASSVYHRMYDDVRDGCGRGWLVYAIPADAKAQTLHYEFDWSHNPAYGQSTGDQEHDRFDWSL